MPDRVAKKVCLLGDYAVGKTSLVRRFVYSIFEEKYTSTIGVRVCRKTLVLPYAGDHVELGLMLWDLAGSQEFERVRKSYLRGMHGALLVCDLTREETLATTAEYVRQVREANSAARLVLVGNKLDLVEQRQVTGAEIESAATELGVPCGLSSAKSGEGVEAAFRQLGRMLLRQE